MLYPELPPDDFNPFSLEPEVVPPGYTYQMGPPPIQTPPPRRKPLQEIIDADIAKGGKGKLPEELTKQIFEYAADFAKSSYDHTKKHDLRWKKLRDLEANNIVLWEWTEYTTNRTKDPSQSIIDKSREPSEDEDDRQKLLSQYVHSPGYI